MGYPCLKAYFHLEVRDHETGRLVRRSRRRLSRSFVQAFAAILAAQMASVQNSVPDTGNTSRNLSGQAGTCFLVAASAGVTNYGPRVGTGTGAVAVTDYALGAAVAEGTGSGQMVHGATTIGPWQATDPNASFTITRTFQNSSGGTITVQEVGLYVQGPAGGTWYFCAVRDLVAGGQAVNNGQTLTLVYTFQTST